MSHNPSFTQTLENPLTPYHTIQNFNDLKTRSSLENIMGKGEHAGNQHFLLLAQCFLSSPKQIQNIKSHLLYRLQKLSN